MVSLVTGARGLLGRHLVPALRRGRTGDVLGVVRRGPIGDSEIECDLSDAPSVARMLASIQPTHIFHLARRFGIQVVVARVFNLLGEGLRDYLRPGDAAGALITLMRMGQPGEIYNVGSGVPVRMREVLTAMLAEAGVPECPVRVEPAHSGMSQHVPSCTRMSRN
jgi:nucleoside-diphosphate-sugar epimerase